MPMNTVLRQKRKELGLTQEQVAQRLGVSVPAVNKWESGTNYPDITLLPALARLLGVDLNTLLCFEDSLTQEEIGQFALELLQTVREEGVPAGFALAEKKLQAYPNCGELLHAVAVQLDGLLMMAEWTEEEKRPYAERLLSWYERAAESGPKRIRDSALFMLASKYAQRKDAETAQKLLDRLPEPNALDKHMIQVDLYLQQGKAAEAAKLMEGKLLQKVNEVQAILLRLTSIELAAGNGEGAEQVAKVAQTMAPLFDLWEYNAHLAPLQLALERRDVEGSIAQLQALLAAVMRPWEKERSPLYHRIAGNLSQGEAKTLLPPLLFQLKNGPKYQFLQQNEAFQALLQTYQKKLEACKE